MASGSRFQLPFATVIDGSGVPLPGAQLFFYQTGTSTPANTYADSALTIPNGNPVVANSAGRFGNIFLNPTVTYKVVLEDQFGSVLWTADPASIGVSGGSSPTNLPIAEAAAPAGVANQIILYTDDGETLKYKDGANTAFAVQTQPVVNNVGSFTSMNATVDTGGRVTSAASGSVLSGVTAAVFAYQVAQGSGSDIGALTIVSWNKRSLNTTLFNSITGASLATNSVTLPAGTYMAAYSMGANGPASAAFSGRLWNATDSIAVTSQAVDVSVSAASYLTQSSVFTIAGPKVFELDMWVNGAGGSGGIALNITGQNETYVRLTLLKLA